MLAGIRDILVITTPADQKSFQKLLGDGSNFGTKITYAIQVKPEGLAQALIIGEEFLKGDSCLMILGDNIFYGVGLGSELSLSLPTSGCHIFTYQVSNPSEYGVLKLNKNKIPHSVVEKPQEYISNLAITGLYFFDEMAAQYARQVQPSPRGELEITSVIDAYLYHHKLTYTELNRGTAWLDTGNPDSLNDAAAFIRIIEERTGLKIACLEEIAYRNGWIDLKHIKNLIKLNNSSKYYAYLNYLH